MNQTYYQGASFAMLMHIVPVAGVNKRPSFETAWVRAADDALREAALAQAVEQYPLPNERLLAYAARNPPPQSWYDEDEDLF